MIRWYPSKIDWWIGLVLCLPPIMSVAVCVALVLDGKSAELPIGLAVIGFVFLIYVGLVFPMRYGLDDTNLIVRFGICRRRIHHSNVIEVYPTRNPLSSPALSLDRLHVRFGEGVFKSVLISPADRECFLEDFAQRAGLKRKGDRLVRQ